MTCGWDEIFTVRLLDKTKRRDLYNIIMNLKRRRESPYLEKILQKNRKQQHSSCHVTTIDKPAKGDMREWVRSRRNKEKSLGTTTEIRSKCNRHHYWQVLP